MNDVSVSPLEAQAFNYLSFGFLTLLNNFWTWIAVSFWRRTRTPTSELLPSPDDPLREDSDPVAVTAVHVPTVVRDVDGARKGKFTLYYEDQYEFEIRECEETVTEDEIDGRGEWWQSWETLLSIRRGDNQNNGWYRCQDLTALNGSVVKLWHPAFNTLNTREPRDTTTASCVIPYSMVN